MTAPVKSTPPVYGHADRRAPIERMVASSLFHRLSFMPLSSPDRQREYLTIQEVAEELRCSEPTVRRRICEGELPAVRLGGPGSGLRVPRAGLEAWLWSEPSEASN